MSPRRGAEPPAAAPQEDAAPRTTPQEEAAPQEAAPQTAQQAAPQEAAPQEAAPQTARDLHIVGIVQGVGFRPFVYRLAHEQNLRGWVQNTGDGVRAHVEGAPDNLAAFISALKREAPPAARIGRIDTAPAAIEGASSFSILPSRERRGAEAHATATPDGAETSDMLAGHLGAHSTAVSPDIATCPKCRAELFDPDNRRFHYPFINCTDCGPRFTIIRALPYDRPNTSMADFEMCAQCAAEYANPLDRRFHAQPDACFACGPHLSLWQRGSVIQAHSREGSDAVIETVAAMLKAGDIVAIKGLGGYHLACDATNESAVAHLRSRKRRTDKPFAVMVHDVREARALCEVSEDEEAVLCGTVRPIVLLRRRRIGQDGESASIALAPSVAGELHELGLMLACTPLHHLLMAQVDVPLVMTSGNLSEEPIIADEEEAHEALGACADAFLDNNRPIVSRYDDSVVRMVDRQLYLVRRARGYAPAPVPFPPYLERGDTVLAVGPEQKSTLALVRESQAFVSQHLGDLESVSSLNAWRQALTHYQSLFDLHPNLIACDQHPEYLSTKWARSQDEPRIEAQHHHAHIASVLAENGLEQAIGIAFDGTGFGDDGTIWGGEVLLATCVDYERIAYLRPVPLPGAAAAIEHPERMAWSYLFSLGLSEHEGAAALGRRIGPDRQALLEGIIAGKLNSPLTSSMGRLFDAVSALLNICTRPSYEGQPAVELEAALYGACEETDETSENAADRYRFTLDMPHIDPTSLLCAILEDLAAGEQVAAISLRFHQALVRMIVEVCTAARQASGIAAVALSGGVFMNRYLLTHTVPALRAAGFSPALNRDLPANDGCIAYGQAVIAAAQLAQLRTEGIELL
ncbi:MAG: carbamoyltransferase HypF [Coriobacteriales bacterium]|nr:carbamoyltransferase HypF [Coriobacteriales bacterium]